MRTGCVSGPKNTVWRNSPSEICIGILRSFLYAEKDILRTGSLIKTIQKQRLRTEKRDVEVTVNGYLVLIKHLLKYPHSVIMEQ